MTSIFFVRVFQMMYLFLGIKLLLEVSTNSYFKIYDYIVSVWLHFTHIPVYMSTKCQQLSMWLLNEVSGLATEVGLHSIATLIHADVKPFPTVL